MAMKRIEPDRMFESAIDAEMMFRKCTYNNPIREPSRQILIGSAQNVTG